MSAAPTEHLVFSGSIDVLFREVLVDRVSPEVAERLRGVGVDLSRKLDPAYPLHVFDNALEVVARHGMPEHALSDAMFRIGQLQVEAFTRTLLGKATFQVLKLVSARRFVERLARTFRQANNYVVSRMEEVDPQTFRVWFNDVGRFPEVFQGILSASAAAVGHDCAVKVLEREGAACWYELRFRA